MRTEMLPLRMPLPSALAACLGIALAHGIAAAPSQRVAPARPIDQPDLSTIVPPYVRLQLARAEAANPNHPETGTDHVVTSCADDGGPGTLRSIIEDTFNTLSGDSINLTMLPMGCSKITLGTGTIHRAIWVQQDTLHIHGPGAEALTIDGNSAQSIFFHFGSGTLGISNLSISNGYYQSVVTYGGGGCIHSNYNVLLLDSVMSDCSAIGRGGAIFTGGYLTLFNTLVERNQALVMAGGVYSHGLLTALYSTIAENTASRTGNLVTAIGGAMSRGGADIEDSTIVGNVADEIGGLQLEGSSVISNSTVSGNTAGMACGIYVSVGSTTIANSTVAFNKCGGADLYHPNGAAIYVRNALATLALQSSIIANNRGGNGQADLGGPIGTVITGAHNLITSWIDVTIPAGTITVCPKLDPLANNGGSTLTHKLRHDSPAIDQGNPGSQPLDQRGDLRVYPDNGVADIGAVEWQPTDHDERILANGFDGVCDW